MIELQGFMSDELKLKSLPFSPNFSGVSSDTVTKGEEDGVVGLSVCSDGDLRNPATKISGTRVRHWSTERIVQRAAGSTEHVGAVRGQGRSNGLLGARPGRPNGLLGVRLGCCKRLLIIHLLLHGHRLGESLLILFVDYPSPSPSSSWTSPEREVEGGDVIDCVKPMENKIMDMTSLEKFLHKRIKVGGKADTLGDSVIDTRKSISPPKKA